MSDKETEVIIETESGTTKRDGDTKGQDGAPHGMNGQGQSKDNESKDSHSNKENGKDSGQDSKGKQVPSKGVNIGTLRMGKTKLKSTVTILRREVLELIEKYEKGEGDTDTALLLDAERKLCNVHGEAMDVMLTLAEAYNNVGKDAEFEKVCAELEKLEEEFTETHNMVQYVYMKNRKKQSQSKENLNNEEKKKESKDEKVGDNKAKDDGKKCVEESQINDKSNKNEQKEKDKQDDKESKKSNEETKDGGHKNNTEESEKEQTKTQTKTQKEETLKFEGKDVRQIPVWPDGYKYMYVNQEDQSPVAQANVTGMHSMYGGAEAINPLAPRSGNPRLEQDMWRQLKRVSIPVFTGDIKTYESWKAAFDACIDRAPATPEYKLLQLREHLKGDALKVIESLGHSPAAYQAAKDRLERKYGGARRRLAMQFEEIHNFKPIRPAKLKEDVEKFADLLDLTMINLKEAGMHSDLDSRLLYSVLLKKMTERMVAEYQRWRSDGGYHESIDVLHKWILKEAEFRTMAHEAVRGFSDRPSESQNDNRKAMGKSFFGQQSPTENQNFVCPVNGCKATNKHGIWHCDVFKKLNVKRRWETAKELKLCYRCLGTNHRGSECKKGRECGINGCKNNHNRLLHEDREEQKHDTQKDREKPRETVRGHDSSTEGSNTNPQQAPSTSMTLTMTGRERTSDENSKFISLRTVPVIVKNGSKRIKVNALLDDASTCTYINSSVAAELGLQGQLTKTTVNVLNGQRETFETMPVKVGLESLNRKVNIEITAKTCENVTGDLQSLDWNDHRTKFAHLKDIDFPKFGRRTYVDLLIGLDYAELHHSIQEILGKPGQPTARLTPLGWTCIGTVETEQQGTACTNFSRSYFSREGSVLQEINSTLRQFWEIEKIPGIEKEPFTREDQAAIAKVEKSVEHENGRYKVEIPWKNEKSELPDNKQMAIDRLQSTEKRLVKSGLGDEYNKIIEQYIEKGYVKKVKPDQQQNTKWYLPHFPVVKEDRATTKVRIVFDASAKFKGIKGTSLNDKIHQGPKLHQDLVNVIMRFRRKPVALICDIREMYLQIEMKPEDRPYHRFLWRNLDQTREPDVYEFQRVVFGVNSSPFLAQFVAQENAKKQKEISPMASETVLNATYMDDSMDSVDSVDDGLRLYSELKDLWGAAGMEARKWLSNSEIVLAAIPPEDRAAEIRLEEGELPSIKTLGVLWKAKEDSFTFEMKPPNKDEKITKRMLLRKIATIFDPIGLVSPYVIRGKVLMQQVWASGIDWDDMLPEPIEREARVWLDELPELSEVKVPRCLRLNPKENIVSANIHAFVDASQDAYAAVLYLRTTYDSGNIAVRFIMSKTKVAPLSAVSIPRMEMMAAILGLHLVQSVQEVLQVEMKDVTFWSDSQNVLWWIRGNSRKLKPFIAHRVGEIQSHTDPQQWRHISGKNNPADIPSRGAKATELVENHSWWQGPEFLTKDETEWPESLLTKGEAVNSEVKSTETGYISMASVTKSADQGKENCAFDRLSPNRFSNWTRLTRVHAWVRRFIENSRLQKTERQKGELSIQELHNVEMLLIRDAQRESFKEEYNALRQGRELPNKSKIIHLTPKMDDCEIMRCGGRLENADELPYDAKFPIILPRGHSVTRLLVKSYHTIGNHALGVNQTLIKISERFWIPGAREEIKESEQNCNVCKRRKAKAATQLMAPLPKVRVTTPLRAFARCSVDYGGPFMTKQGRGKVQTKRYLCCFTCMASRAVHLEMAYSLDTDSFLNALHRMINRRGVMQELWSDHGTNFVSANREMKELISQFDQQRITNDTAKKGITWHYSPPAGPHFGGVHETMIKAAKKAIYAILNKADITDEELHTAFTGAEALINSRPLTYQTSDPRDDLPLTPNHFLHGQLGGQFAPEAVDGGQFNPKKRWRRVQELLKNVWRRWMSEWLPMLQPRSKWTKINKDIKVGDVALVIEPNSPRGKWPLGRVLELYPGKDGHTRVVKLQVGKTTLVRPIVKLCPLNCE